MSVIGIDLGTTSSSVSIFRNGSVELLEVEQTNRAMPSCVAFAGKERLVGQRALAQLVDNPKNTICGVKTIIGLTYEEANRLRNWNFDLENDSSKPKILVQCGEGQKSLHPEEITAMILSRLWQNTKQILHEEPEGAVITVPASFNHAQRKATLDAAKIAGVPVLELINEPTAAALAYQYQSKTETQTKMLILHLGGGAFNVSVIICDEGNINVKASIGSSQFGGMNFDDQLFEYFTDTVRGEEIRDARKKGIQTTSSCKLRMECETAKKKLCAAPHVKVKVKALLRNGNDFLLSIDRKQFRQINQHIFEAIKTSINSVLEEAKVAPSEVNDVLTIGNSTRLSFIDEILTKDFGFDRSQLRKTIKPDEVAATGAALRATMLSKKQNSKENNFGKIQDVLPNGICTKEPNSCPYTIFRCGDNFPNDDERNLANETNCIRMQFYSNRLEIVGKTFKWKMQQRLMTEIIVLCHDRNFDKFRATINSSGLFSIRVSSKYGKITRNENCGLCADEIEKLIKDRKLNCSEDEERSRKDNAVYKLEKEAYSTQAKYRCDLSRMVEWIKNTPNPSWPQITEQWKFLEAVKQGKQKQCGKTEAPKKEEKPMAEMEMLQSLLRALGTLDPASKEQISPKDQSQIQDSYRKSVANQQQAQKTKDISQSDLKIAFMEARAEITRLKNFEKENIILGNKIRRMDDALKQLVEISQEEPQVIKAEISQEEPQARSGKNQEKGEPMDFQ